MTSSTKKAIVDPDLCIGCNTCPLMDPDVFEMDLESYKAIVKSNAPITDKTESARTACPVNAISIVE